MSIAPARNGQHVEESPASMGENVANLACDLVTLAELQMKLVGLDLCDGTQEARTPALAIAASCSVFLGATPVVLLALGGLLSEWTTLSPSASWLLVAVLALLIAAVTTWWALGRLKRASQVILRSRAEFQENLTWIKKVIQQTSMSKT